MSPLPRSVVVIDGIESWRSAVSTILRNQGFSPMEFADLEAATVVLNGLVSNVNSALAGICLDLRFAKNDSVATAGRKVREIDLFLDLVRQKFPAVSMLIISDDIEAGLKTVNELTQVGLKAAFVSKSEVNVVKNIADTVTVVFGDSGVVHPRNAYPPISSKQKTDLIIVFTLAGGLAFACITGAVGVWLFGKHGLFVLTSYLVFVILAFAAAGLFALTQTGALPPKDLKGCLTVLLSHLNPLDVLKYLKRDRK
jgi:hypothetical protein